MKKKDPKVGTGKKPKNTGRRLYTDENPKDTVSIKYATVAYARKIQILTVVEQRARFANKPEQAKLAKQAKITLRKKNDKNKRTTA